MSPGLEEEDMRTDATCARKMEDKQLQTNMEVLCVCKVLAGQARGSRGRWARRDAPTPRSPGPTLPLTLKGPFPISSGLGPQPHTSHFTQQLWSWLRHLALVPL